MSTKTIKGNLKYITYWQPIDLDQGSDKKTDIRSIIFDAFEKMNGKKVHFQHNSSEDLFSVITHKEAKSDFTFETKKNGRGLYTFIKCECYTDYEKGGHSTQMVDTLLDHALQSLNSRNIILTIADDGIIIKPDPKKDDVHEVKYFGEGNMSKIEGDDMLKNVCKAGNEDACIFIMAGHKGFSCAKFSAPTARIVLDRYNKGRTHAKRIGNCKNVGRIKEDEEKQ